MMFNVFGVVWVVILLEGLVWMVEWIIWEFMKVREGEGVGVCLKV